MTRFKTIRQDKGYLALCKELDERKAVNREQHNELMWYRAAFSFLNKQTDFASLQVRLRKHLKELEK